MSDSLLTTKFFISYTRPELVPRPRLIERLNAGLHRKLTLISAPAGFGKTTLVASWLDDLRLDTKNKIAWLSLDEGDNDYARFLTYFITALNRAEGIEETIGEGVLSMLQSPQPPLPQVIITSLINEFAPITGKIVFVLDDYHLIEAQSIQDALTFLLEHLPPQIHLVFITRDDPHLPLPRLRSQDQLTELRATDLRFTSSEAAEFLNQVMGLDLSAEDIAALETRTEGWIAGLQMAALSMQGRADTASFIQAFTGSHRYVLDYLVEEVLQHQPEHIRTFLLQTSILNRLCSPLCDFVTGQEDGRGMLEDLERGNLFIVPLDDKRQWYRYHHLFADVLQARLMEEQPDKVPVLHRQASEWFEQNGLRSDAIRQAFIAEDFERAAGLVELARRAMEMSFQTVTWLGWVKKLPDELVRSRPVLSVGYAWALLDRGELEAVEVRLRDAERWLDTTADTTERPEVPSAEMVVVDEEEFRILPATIASARAYHAQLLGDVPGTVKYAELALKLTPEEDYLVRAQATVLLGFIYWASGDLEAAHKAMVFWINSMQKAGNIVVVIGSTFALADIMVGQGRLREAVRAYQQSLQLASEQDERIKRVTAHLYLGLTMLYHEMGDQEAAAQYLLKSRELGEQNTLVDWPYRWRLAQARLKEAEGDLEAALDLLDEAKRLYVRNSSPDLRPIEALKAKVYVRQGRLPKALVWVQEQSLSVDDELSYLSEFEHIMLARVLITEYQSNRAERPVLQAIGLLERILKAAEEGKRMGSVIEILVLLALAHQAQGNIPLALASLERALALAEPEGYVRIFVDEGAPMAALLKRIKAEDEMIMEYIRKLLAAFADKKFNHSSLNPQPLVDPLSERECEVLKLLTTELSGPEIAKELMVSMNTIRTHTKNIYSKLGVNSRRDAVKQAKELKLI